MRSLSILCLLLISASSFPSQCAQSPAASTAPNKENATVAGNVLRLDTGEPLKKAKVILLGTGPEGVYVFYLTDEQGHFLFENVPPGRRAPTSCKSSVAVTLKRNTAKRSLALRAQCSL